MCPDEKYIHPHVWWQITQYWNVYIWYDTFFWLLGASIHSFNVYNIYLYIKYLFDMYERTRSKLSGITAYIFRFIRKWSVMTNLRYLPEVSRGTFQRHWGLSIMSSRNGMKNTESSRPANGKPGRILSLPLTWRFLESVCFLAYKTGELYFKDSRNLPTKYFFIWFSKEQRTSIPEYGFKVK